MEQPVHSVDGIWMKRAPPPPCPDCVVVYVVITRLGFRRLGTWRCASEHPLPLQPRRWPRGTGYAAGWGCFRVPARACCSEAGLLYIRAPQPFHDRGMHILNMLRGSEVCVFGGRPQAAPPMQTYLIWATVVGLMTPDCPVYCAG